jgi:hypothetical protein
MQAMSRVTNRKTYGILWLLLPALLVLVSCSSTSTKFTDVWRDKAFEGQFTRMLIIGAAEDQNVRAFYEDEFTRELARRGLDARSSYPEIPPEKVFDKEAILETSRALGADAVLVTAVVERRKVKKGYRIQFVPFTKNEEETRRPGSGGLDEGYQAEGRTLRDPEKVMVRLAINLYDVETQKLVWSAASKLFLQGAGSGAVEPFVRALAGKLAEAGLVGEER